MKLAEAKMDDILDFEDEMFFQYYGSSKMSISESTIWHYTGISGLKGVTKNPKELCLWFTDKDYLNDSSEGKDIKIIYDKVCKTCFSKHEVSSDFFEVIKDVAPSSKRVFFKRDGDSLSPFISEFQLYVCCFAKEGDLLDLWRYYSKGEPGYALRISTGIINQITTKYKNLGIDYIYACDVIYNDEEKEMIIHKTIVELYELFKKQNSEKSKKTISDFLSYYLSVNQLLFKASCFSSERECRIIISLPSDTSKCGIKKEFRASPNGLIPYVEVKTEGYHLLEIKTDPFHKSNSENQTKVLIDYCHDKELNCDISVSKLPVRF